MYRKMPKAFRDLLFIWGEFQIAQILQINKANNKTATEITPIQNPVLAVPTIQYGIINPKYVSPEDKLDDI